MFKKLKIPVFKKKIKTIKVKFPFYYKETHKGSLGYKVEVSGAVLDKNTNVSVERFVFSDGSVQYTFHKRPFNIDGFILHRKTQCDRRVYNTAMTQAIEAIGVDYGLTVHPPLLVC